MLLICAINVVVGVCAYERAPESVQRIEPVLPVAPDAAPVPEGTITLGQLPTPIMRAFTAKHPQHVPHAVRRLDEQRYELTWLDRGAARSEVFTLDPRAVAP